MASRRSRARPRSRVGLAAALAACVLASALCGAPSLKHAAWALGEPQGTHSRAIESGFSDWNLRLSSEVTSGVVTAALPSSGESAGLRASRIISVAMPVRRLGISDQWARVLASDPASLFDSTCNRDEALCQSSLMRLWRYLHARYAGHAYAKIDLIRELNQRVNRVIHYGDDLLLYGVDDYWASPEETARQGAGDCEDFAIVKMWMLAALDVPLASMQIVVVNDTRRGANHAVLKLGIGETQLILDNLSEEVVPVTALPWYRPLYAVGVGGSWIYGTMPVVAELKSEASMDARLELRGAIPLL